MMKALIKNLMMNICNVFLKYLTVRSVKIKLPAKGVMKIDIISFIIKLAINAVFHSVVNVSIFKIAYNVIIIIIISSLPAINHVFVLMVSLIIQSKISANYVLMVVKPVMTKDMINVLLVALIQTYLSIINWTVQINVF